MKYLKHFENRREKEIEYIDIIKKIITPYDIGILNIQIILHYGVTYYRINLYLDNKHIKDYKLKDIEKYIENCKDMVSKYKLTSDYFNMDDDDFNCNFNKVQVDEFINIHKDKLEANKMGLY